MTFTEWLLRSVARNNIRGDLARDVQRDGTFPKAPKSVEEILTAMGHGAIPEARAAAKRAWRDYQRHLRR